MELVYLWVEDYKNIKKQGFNFSPRFECDFDGETLTIDEKKENEYVKDFFGENINVTAIVGKNGSGKSSVLEVLNWILEKSYNERTIIVYFHCSSLYYISNIKVDISKINMPITKIDDIEDLKHYIYTTVIDCTGLKKYDTTNQVLLDISSIGNMISNSYIQEQKFELTTFMYIPSKMNIKLIDLDQKFRDTYNSVYHEKYSDEISFENELDYTKTPEEDYADQINLPAKMDDLKRELEDIANIKKSLLDAFENSEDDFHKFLLINYISLGRAVSENNILKDTDKLWNECFSKYFIDENSFYKSFQTQEVNIFKLSEAEKNIYFSAYKEYFNLDFIDIKGRKFNHLSHGERIIFSQFINIYFHVLESKEENFIFLFDEPELSLHPNWQKKYLFELHSLLLKLNKKIHFLFTSHSPFLLSDIPKQNIIFLDKEDNGNCKVLNHDEVLSKEQTFGANIHTLLSDSFFMEDGLMGEFAKSKINEIISFHKTVQKKRHINCLKKIYLANRKNKFWQTQSIIGEEYLKQVIKNHLVEIEKILLGKDEAKKEEIVRVEAYLESLKK